MWARLGFEIIAILCEWAALYKCVCHNEYAADTLFVRDGFCAAISSATICSNACAKHANGDRARAAKKRSLFWSAWRRGGKVLARYNLAMAVEKLFAPGDPRMVRVSDEMEKRAYLRPDYAAPAARRCKAKARCILFASARAVADPVWLADVFFAAREHAERIFGHLLSDSLDGFPVPLYPRCLQQAHERRRRGVSMRLCCKTRFGKSVHEMLDQGERSALDHLRLAQNLAARRYE